MLRVVDAPGRGLVEGGPTVEKVIATPRQHRSTTHAEERRTTKRVRVTLI